jgi:serine/threonine-protein kinase
VRGGPATTLWSTSELPLGSSWGPNDQIVLATQERETGLLLLPAGGGEPRVLTRPDASRGERDHQWPEFLPDGKAILFDIVSDRNETRVAVLSLATGDQKVLIPDAANARYVETDERGYLLFAALGTSSTTRTETA